MSDFYGLFGQIGKQPDNERLRECIGLITMPRHALTFATLRAVLHAEGAEELLKEFCRKVEKIAGLFAQDEVDALLSRLGERTLSTSERAMFAVLRSKHKVNVY